MDVESCHLCPSNQASLFYRSVSKNLAREYFKCDSCQLVFVPDRFHLEPHEQKKRYKEHNNDPNDFRYRDFLSRLLGALRPHLQSGTRGIDYGSGPGPALATMLEEDGFQMAIYDLFFQPDKTVLKQSYDFVTCTETVEHFVRPKTEFQVIDKILNPGGWIGIMTSLITDESKFPDWYYQRDPTHICFYSKNTMMYISKTYGWDVFFPKDNVVLYHKPV